MLRPELAHAVGGERFLREMATTATLRHPHILPLYDSGNADGALYFVMPLVEGESLRDRLDREGRLPIAEALLATPLTFQSWRPDTVDALIPPPPLVEGAEECAISSSSLPHCSLDARWEQSDLPRCWCVSGSHTPRLE